MRSIRVLLESKRRMRKGRRRREREIGFRLGTTEGTGGGVVGTGGVLCRIEGAEPDARLLPRVSDLSGESPPRSLSDASESRLFPYIARSRSDGRRRCSCRRGSSRSPHDLVGGGNPKRLKSEKGEERREEEGGGGRREKARVAKKPVARNFTFTSPPRSGFSLTYLLFPL